MELEMVHFERDGGLQSRDQRRQKGRVGFLVSASIANLYYCPGLSHPIEQDPTYDDLEQN